MCFRACASRATFAHMLGWSADESRSDKQTREKVEKSRPFTTKPRWTLEAFKKSLDEL